MNAATKAMRQAVQPKRLMALMIMITLLFGYVPAASVQAELVTNAVPVGPNLLVNGSFESVTGGLPSSWSRWVASGTPQYVIDEAVFKDGGKSIRIQADATARNSLTQSVGVEPGASYQLSAWVKMDNIVSTDRGVVIRYQFYNSSNQKIGTDSFAGARKGTQNWEQITQKVTVPEGAVRMLFELFLWNATGTVWFDDAKLSKEVSITDMITTQHPRLLATAADFAALQQRIQTDVRLSDWYGRLTVKANQILTEPASQYEIPDGVRLLAVSRKVLERILALGMQYRISGDSRYAERAWTELEAAGNFKDWNPSHFLDTAEMTHAFAIGYDWLYDYWTEERRAFLRNSIITKGFIPALAGYNKPEFWVNTTNNWNFVVNGGIGMGALALGDEPEVKAMAEDLLQRGFNSLPKALGQWAPDGGWYEGPGYWQYSIQYIGVYFKALQTALGTDFNLSQSPGLPQNGDFPIFMSSPVNQIFNFADAGSGVPNSPSLHWFGEQFNKPEYGWWQTQRVNMNPSPLDLLWYMPNNYAGPRAANVPLDKYFRNVEAVTFRSAWEDPQALYAGFKGASEQKNHHNLDAGTFVFDALGIRWAQELGADNYNLPGYFGNQRWNYYRMRGEGQNVLVINPGQGPEQDDSKSIVINRVESTPQEALAVADLTAAYASEVHKAERGIRLLDNRRQMLVQDEVHAKAPSDYWWFMHTSTDIKEIAKDGSWAMLSKDGKRLWARILSPSQAKFVMMDPEPLPTSPNPDGQNPNSGIRKLAIHVEDVQNLQLSVLMVPLREGEAPPTQLPAVQPLSQWQTNAATAPLLSGISLDGVPLAGFEGRTFTYDAALPLGTTNAPIVTATAADAGASVTISQADSLPGAAWIDVSKPGGGSARYAVYFPGKSNAGQAGLPIVAVTASGDDGNVPSNTIDDDLGTRWSALGDGQWISYDLGSAQTVRSVSIAWYRGMERTSSFDIDVSADGTSWARAFSGSSSGNTDELENYNTGEQNVRYIRIVGHGNSQNEFNSISEVRIYDQVVPGQTKPPSLKAVALASDLTELKVTQSAQLHLTGTMTTGEPLDRSRATVEYVSTDKDVVSVSGSGLVTANGVGTAKVAAFVELDGYLKFAVVEFQVIDPLSLKLLPVKDAFVRSGDYADTNYGTATSLTVKKSTPNFGRETFFQFDLNGIAGDLNSAVLYLYGVTNDTAGTEVDNTVRAVSNDSWMEKEVTWNNKPETQEPLSTVTVDNVAGWRAFDITSYIAGQLSGDKTASMAIVQDVSSGLATNFNSRENGSFKPYLELKLTDSTAPVIGVSGVTEGLSYPVSASPVVTASDVETGVKSLIVKLNEQPFVSGTAVTALGLHTLSASATDFAGNQASESVTFAVYDPARGPVTIAGWFPESTAGDTVTGNTYGKIHLTGKLGYGGGYLPEGMGIHLQSSGLKLEMSSFQYLVIDDNRVIVEGSARGADNERYVVRLTLTKNESGSPRPTTTASFVLWKGDETVPVMTVTDQPLTGAVTFHKAPE
ncbi:DNRLRE domain-containing protein [Paenibacillus sp. NPDC056579]|uniref:CBM96 family carbohydrate-binding protein n=1 Tax=Paenibacillus sp. NPDC056579 TaxID=3345871 RepID=UPI0036D0699A